MRLSNKIAIVTGAGSGFGEGIARTFAREGASVVVNDLDEEKARQVADSINAAGQDLAQGSAQGSALFFAGDVTAGSLQSPRRPLPRRTDTRRRYRPSECRCRPPRTAYPSQSRRRACRSRDHPRSGRRRRGHRAYRLHHDHR